MLRYIAVVLSKNRNWSQNSPYVSALIEKVSMNGIHEHSEVLYTEVRGNAWDIYKWRL
jgi:hypothetical protein